MQAKQEDSKQKPNIPNTITRRDFLKVLKVLSVGLAADTTALLAIAPEVLAQSDADATLHEILLNSDQLLDVEVSEVSQACRNLVGPGRAPSQADLNSIYEQLKNSGCIKPEAQWSQTIFMGPEFATVALPLAAAEPSPIEEAILLTIFFIGATTATIFYIKNGDYNGRHSSVEHDPTHPNGEKARNIIRMIKDGGVAFFCVAVKVSGRIRHIVTTPIDPIKQTAGFALAWFDDHNNWSGAYVVNGFYKNVEAILNTSGKIEEYLGPVEQICQNLPAAKW